MVKKHILNVVKCLIFISILATIFVPTEMVTAELEDSPLYQSSAYDLIAEVNTLRVASGLPEYVVSPILMGTAQAQADFMASTGSVTHAGPGGITLTQRLLNAGYPLAGDLSLGGFRAENITGGAGKTAAQAVQQWLGDAEHINTMLSPVLVEIGAGVAVSGGTVYYVIDCARPTTSGAPQAISENDVGGISDNSIGGTPGAEVVPQYMAPVLTVTPDSEGLVYHEVLNGQSLWSLAIAYGVKIDEIRALNSLSPEYVIQIGDRLLIRKDASLVTPAYVVTITTPEISSVQIATLLSTPTALPATFASTEKVEPVDEENSIAGMVVAIILIALLLAGTVTWWSARKPV